MSDKEIHNIKFIAIALIGIYVALHLISCSSNRSRLIFSTDSASKLERTGELITIKYASERCVAGSSVSVERVLRVADEVVCGDEISALERATGAYMGVLSGNILK